MKKKIGLILFIVGVLLIISFLIPHQVYGFDGGKILDPVLKLLTALCDGIIDILQKTLFGIEDDALFNINRTQDFWSRLIGNFAATIFLSFSVAVAALFAFATGGVGAAIAVGISTAILSIGKTVVTYFAVSMLASQMLPGSFYLPFIQVSPDTILKNQIPLFDINYFEDTTVDLGIWGEFDKPEDKKSLANNLHETIASWYYTLRNIVIVFFMILLIYIGIRILISSSSSEERAKYKKMLIDWLVSFCLIFLIHYFMIFSMDIVDKFNEMIGKSIRGNSVEYFDIKDDAVYDAMEDRLEEMGDIEPPTTEEATPIPGGEEYSTLYKDEDGNKCVRFPVDNFLSQVRLKMQLIEEDENYADEDGTSQTAESIGYNIIYIMLTLYTLLFTWIYLKRVVYIGFLILVSPFVVLTYSIDRFHDGQAQGFNTWIKEYLFNLMIQPFHLIIFVVFVNSAMELASNNAIYVLVIMGFIPLAEKILRNMFGFNKASTAGTLSGTLGAGLAMAGIQKFFSRRPSEPSTIEKGIHAAKDISNKGEVKQQNFDVAIDKEEDKKELLDSKNTDSNTDKGKTPTLKDSNKDKASLLDDESNEKEEYDESVIEIPEDDFNIGNNNNAHNNSENEKSANDSNIENSNSIKKEENQKILDKTANESFSNGVEYAKNELEKNQKEKTKKKKIKFDIKKGLKGAARHYIQSKGSMLAARAKNVSLPRTIASGAAGLTAATAGVFLGAMEGSPEKAIRNAGVLGAVAYKGTSSWIKSEKVDGVKESYIESGYGDDYRQYKKQKLAREIKYNLENRTILEEELGYDKKEIKRFFQESLDEYINEGVKTINEMVIGEKLKLNKVVSNTKQAIAVMEMGERVGTDTTKLTKKKRDEWAETLSSQSTIVSKMKEQERNIQKKYDKQIKDILNKKLEEKRETQEIAKIEEERKNDSDLNEIQTKIRTVETQALEKLDQYSKIKYKR